MYQSWNHFTIFNKCNTHKQHFSKITFLLLMLRNILKKVTSQSNFIGNGWKDVVWLVQIQSVPCRRNNWKGKGNYLHYHSFSETLPGIWFQQNISSLKIHIIFLRKHFCSSKSLASFRFLGHFKTVITKKLPFWVVLNTEIRKKLASKVMRNIDSAFYHSKINQMITKMWLKGFFVVQNQTLTVRNFL